MAVKKMLMSRQGIYLFICITIYLAGCDKFSSVYDKSTKKESSTAVTPSTNKVIPASEKISSDGSKPKDNLPSNVLASVGEWSITIEEFNDKLTKLKEILPEFDPKDINSKKLILEELVRQELLVKDAEQKGVSQQKEIKETVEDFRKTLLVQEVATQLTKEIKTTEEEAREYYDNNKDNFVVKSEWKVREIMVPTENEAKEILVQLLQGGDFLEIAKSKSKSSSASKSGDLGWISKFSFDQMRSAVTALETGKTSGVFKGPNGYYIVKLDEKKGGTPKPFLAIKSDLIKKLTLKKQQDAVLDHLNKLAEKTNIKVNEELLK